MKIKLMFGLMLMFCSYFVSAQNFLPADLAIAQIDAELQAWEDGTVDVNSIFVGQPAQPSGNIPIASVGQYLKPGTMMNAAAFTGILQYAREQIEEEKDTSNGMNNVFARFPTNTENQASQALAYVTQIVTN